MRRTSYLSGFTVLIALILAALGSPQAAEIYHYVTPDGTAVYTNWPPLNSPTKKQSPFYTEVTPVNDPKRGNSSVNLPQNYSSLIRKVSSDYGLDPNLIQAIIQVESNFDPKAISPKGAMGIMQLMPETVRLNKVTDPFNPEENLNGGARHVRYLLDTYDNNLDLVLAAYNAGEGVVNRYGSIPPYPETIDYVTKVKSLFFSSTKVKGTKLYVIKSDGAYIITDLPSYNMSNFSPAPYASKYKRTGLSSNP